MRVTNATSSGARTAVPRRRWLSAPVPNQRAADVTVRSVAIPDALWQRAQARADRDGVKVSAVVRAALEEYVKEGNRGN